LTLVTQVDEAAIARPRSHDHGLRNDSEIGADGVLACSGGEFGGWSLFIEDGRLHYVHDYLKLQEFNVASAYKAPSDAHSQPPLNTDATRHGALLVTPMPTTRG
jgi:arylsulfatase